MKSLHSIRSLTLTALTAACLITALPGCAPVLVGGAMVGGGLVALDRRTSGAQLEDEGIELRGAARVREALGERAHINITSYNRQVLLTGEAASAQDRQNAEQIISRVENVRSVVNDIGVMGNTSLGQRSNDTFVTGRVKAALVDARDLQSHAFKVVTERGVVYLLGRRWWSRYAVILALLAGLLAAAGRGMLHLQAITVQLGMPVFTMPAFSPAAMIGVALPLFVVTMASQNVPGIGVLCAAGYRPPVSQLIGWVGVVNLLLAPFGAYALNLSTITAAIVTGPEAHPDPDKRYIAGVAAGVFYALVGLFGATVAATLLALPKELVWAIAGFALLGTIGNGLLAALNHERHREAALVTFLVTASGITLFGVGSAFWGLLGGVLVLVLLHGGRG